MVERFCQELLEEGLCLFNVVNKESMNLGNKYMLDVGNDESEESKRLRLLGKVERYIVNRYVEHAGRRGLNGKTRSLVLTIVRISCC